jgi:hypothetical protein
MLKLSAECMSYITKRRPEKTGYMKILVVITSRIARIQRLRSLVIAPSCQLAGRVSGFILRLAPAIYPKGFCTLNIEDQMVLYALQ